MDRPLDEKPQKNIEMNDIQKSLIWPDFWFFHFLFFIWIYLYFFCFKICKKLQK